MNKILAADIGGTNIRAAVVNHDGNIDNEMRSHIELGDRTMSESQLIHLLVLFFEDMLKEYNDIKAIGAGFPGFFLGDSGLLVASPNLPNLHNVELAAKLSDKLNIPVHIQN
ncbi:MAG: ROK family protein, partial [Mariprofundus sp.]